MTISEAVSLYRDERRTNGYSDDTIERVVANTIMMAREIGARRVADLDTETILEWGLRKIEQGCKATTLGTYYNSIRSFIRYAKSHVPGLDIDTTRLRSAGKYRLPRVLQLNEVKHVMKFCSEETAILMSLLFTSGLRISEALSLDGNSIMSSTRVYVRRKGGAQSVVIVPIDVGYQLKALAYKNGGGYCFTDKDGNQLNRHKAYYYIKQAFVRAGYDWAHPHTFRHSFCTELLRKDSNLMHVSRLMRHANVATTQRYTHLVLDDIAKTHRRLGW